MSVVLRTVDLTPIVDAVKTGDAETFARVASELGLDLSLDTFLSYAKPFYPSHAEWLGRTFFKLAYTALHERAEYETLLGLTMLVARSSDRLVLGIQHSPGRSRPFPKDGWAIGRWYKDPAKNLPTVEAWATDPARRRDALIVPITRLPDAVSSDDKRGDDLLAAVVANPDDVAARLVYADWLAEQGDARGELIRVQCDLAAPDLAPDRRAALIARQGELLGSAGKGMRAAVESFAESVGIERGLVERVEIRVVKLAKYGAELVAKHPICVLSIIVSGPAEFARLGTLPFLARIPQLRIEARKTPRILMSRAPLKPSALAKSPIFANTRELQLSYLDDDSAEWQRWFTEIDAPNLERLVLRHPGFKPAVLETLAQAHVLPRLRFLEIDYPMFARSARGAEAVADAMTALAKRSLVEVNLWSWHIPDRALATCVRALLASSKLESLGLFNCVVEEATVDALCDGGARLARLSIRNHVRSSDALMPLFTARFPVLRELELDAEQLSEAQTEHITRGLLVWPSLRRVTWRSAPLSDTQRARLRERVQLDD